MEDNSALRRCRDQCLAPHPPFEEMSFELASAFDPHEAWATSPGTSNGIFNQAFQHENSFNELQSSQAPGTAEHGGFIDPSLLNISFHPEISTQAWDNSNSNTSNFQPDNAHSSTYNTLSQDKGHTPHPHSLNHLMASSSNLEMPTFQQLLPTRIQPPGTQGFTHVDDSNENLYHQMQVDPTEVDAEGLDVVSSSFLNQPTSQKAVWAPLQHNPVYSNDDRSLSFPGGSHDLDPRATTDIAEDGSFSYALDAHLGPCITQVAPGTANNRESMSFILPVRPSLIPNDQGISATHQGLGPISGPLTLCPRRPEHQAPRSSFLPLRSKASLDHCFIQSSSSATESSQSVVCAQVTLQPNSKTPRPDTVHSGRVQKHKRLATKKRQEISGIIPGIPERYCIAYPANPSVSEENVVQDKKRNERNSHPCLRCQEKKVKVSMSNILCSLTKVFNFVDSARGNSLPELSHSICRESSY
jgi:hypothetical protein